MKPSLELLIQMSEIAVDLEFKLIIQKQITNFMDSELLKREMQSYLAMVSTDREYKICEEVRCRDATRFLNDWNRLDQECEELIISTQLKILRLSNQAFRDFSKPMLVYLDQTPVA
jgi:hypothetical protein